MPFSRRHDRYDHISLSTSLTRISFLIAILHSVGATPVDRTQRRLLVRSTNEADAASPTSIWIPAAIGLAFLTGLIIVAWANKRLRTYLLNRGHQPAGATAPRELTAEQLAGTINNGARTTPGTTLNQPVARTRRTRRPRRTPSQMSVTSLPEYQKEPGEQELVIFRGTDMEDAPVPREEHEDDDADTNETPTHSRNGSQTVYSPLPTQNNDTDNSQQPGRLSRNASRRSSRNDGLPRSSEEQHGLMDERGEAPAYFEVVDMQSQPSQTQNEPQTAAAITPTEAPPQTVSPPPEQRMSGFRTFLNRMSVVGAPRGLTHARMDSGASSTTGERPSSPNTTSRHRPTLSNASSIFRTMSRQSGAAGSSNALTSPSMISLGSISAPLTHTLTRTEITYPKSGPTPEQIKMISSRESIARFGVPYGEEARAFASTSRLDLRSPPPDFDSVVAERSGAHARTESGGTRRSSFVRAETPRVAEAEEASVQTPSTSTDNQASSSTSAPPSTSIRSKAATATTYQSISSSTQPSVSEFGVRLEAPPSAWSQNGNTGTNASSMYTSRSESRASGYSVQTFATAAESVGPRGFSSRASNRNENDTDDDDDDDSIVAGPPAASASTASRAGLAATQQEGVHGKEETDATIIAAAPRATGSVSAK